MSRHLFRELLRRPLGAAALATLLALYLGALFAGFLATAPVNRQDLSATWHPPTRVFWQDGGLRVQAYRLADPSAPDYVAVPGQSFRLRLFARGFDYRLLGLVPLQRHLLQVDAGESDAGGTPARTSAAGETPAPLQTGGFAVHGLEARATSDAGGGTPVASLVPRLYLLGSDSTGRDVFSRLVYGSRVSLLIGLIGISITLTLGLLVGGLSGYFGGRIDFLAMRGVEFLMAIPSLYLLLALRSALAPYFKSDRMFFVIVIILAFIGWAGAARVLRGMSLSIRRQQFVLAAESMGQSPVAILKKHILPNLASYLLVAATLSIPGYILGEAALSFLGLGIAEPASSWGLMLSQAQSIKVFMLNFWWLLAPGFAIFVTVIAFNVLGDCLRDIVDPKMKTG
ncbi:MAG: ABC transporter permease [Opitutaceae bacterium]|jgi:peptide/nickel transport system permease protein|nr:ABC transporter permease [Opitutaceae bacterium]